MPARGSMEQGRKEGASGTADGATVAGTDLGAAALAVVNGVAVLSRHHGEAFAACGAEARSEALGELLALRATAYRAVATRLGERFGPRLRHAGAEPDAEGWTGDDPPPPTADDHERIAYCRRLEERFIETCREAAAGLRHPGRRAIDDARADATTSCGVLSRLLDDSGSRC